MILKLILAQALLCALIGCHDVGAAPPSQGIACPTTPPELAPPLGNEVAFALDVDQNGVQRYSCTPLGWSTGLPAAAMITPGPDTRQVVAMFAGPTWMAVDGSNVVAIQRAGVTVDPAALPWLDLEVTTHNDTPGVLAPITWVQRLTTRAGLAPPAEACDAAHVGLEQDVAFSARFWFYRSGDPAVPGVRCGA